MNAKLMLAFSAKCMGRDVANAMADSEEADTLVPHLHQLIANAGKQKVHGDQSPPAEDDPYHAPMTFKVLTNASADQVTEILAIGAITKEYSSGFQDVSRPPANSESGNVIIRLNSPGGLLRPAFSARLGTSPARVFDQSWI